MNAICDSLNILQSTDLVVLSSQFVGIYTAASSNSRRDTSSGGASEVQEPGHFPGEKTSSQVSPSAA
jgi:hypothetical protein